MISRTISKILTIYLVYSLGLALLKFLLYSFGSTYLNALGFLLFLAQIPALPLTYPLKKVMFDMILGINVSYFYHKSALFPVSGGFAHLLNDLIVILLSLVTYSIYFLIYKGSVKKSCV